MNVRLYHFLKILSNLFLAAAILCAALAPAGTAQAAKPVQSVPGVDPIWPIGGAITYATVDQPRALPLFRWEAIAGAKTYQVDIDTAIDFTGVRLITLTTSWTVWAPTVANLPDGQTLYWRVKVKTGANGEGPYGPTETFIKDWTRLSATTENTTTLLQPDDYAEIAYTDQEPGDFTNRPAFSWTPVIGATYYLLQFSMDESFAPASIEASFTTLNTTYQLLEKLADGPYYWRVVPMQDGSPDWDGQPSGYRVVVFNYNTAFAPALIAPANASEPEFTPTFRWTSVRGAERYYLQYATSSNFLSGVVTISTFATSYTPTSPLLNNQDYYWRVRVKSGLSNSDIYSPTRRFRKMWYHKPSLLTPTQGYAYVIDPYFSWTPVPGAASYRLEVDNTDPLVGPKSAETTNTFYIFPSKTLNCPPFSASYGNRVFWQVTAIDAAGHDGGKSEVHSFDCNWAAGAPVQVYPPMYYPTLTNPVMDPREDHTVPLPMFSWKRLLNGAERSQSAAYRIQVGNQENIEMNGGVLYTFDTQNMNAIPNLSSVLPDGGGQTDYFWRVRPLDAMGGEVGQWSQEWRMRWNHTLQPAATAAIQPLRPIWGSEWVETLPLFEWLPLQNATAYQVQISDSAAFDTSSPFWGTYTVQYPAYSHPHRLASGTYYWRVQGMNGSVEMGWSTPIRFQVAAQSRWRSSRPFGSNNTPVIAADPAGDAGSPNDANFDLTNLSATQGGSNWYFGFNVTTGADMKYAVYIDTDHIENSGGVDDPESYDITTIAAHRPEYVLYIYQVGGVFSRTTSRIYTWDRGLNRWATAALFSQREGADLLYNPTSSYLEIVMPGSFIGQSGTVSSVAVSVLSLANTSGGPYDSVPTDPAVLSTAPGASAQISRFASATDRINQIYPTYKPANDPQVFGTIPAFFWQPLVEVPEYLYSELRIGLDMDDADPNYMTVIINDGLYNHATGYTFTDDVEGDEPTYYWQIRPVYPTPFVGGWSQVSGLQRTGEPAAGLTVTSEQWNPTFTWNLAEGAYDYYLQIDDDPNFVGSPFLTVTTKLNTYTPNTKTFDDGKVYYARVQLGRTSSITSVFSDVVQFTVQRPVVNGLRSIPVATQAAPSHYNPTFCWDPIPSAFTYLFEVGWDPAFQTPFYGYETEENCLTVPIGRLDGEFYWRVYMVDGFGASGPPSTVQEFWKLYPAPTPLFPLKAVAGTPVFRWSGVDGADKYYLEISDKADFSTIKYSATTVNTEHQPNKALGFGDYYWRVRIIDRNSVDGPFSDFVYIEYEKTFMPMVRK